MKFLVSLLLLVLLLPGCGANITVSFSQPTPTPLPTATPNLEATATVQAQATAQAATATSQAFLNQQAAAAQTRAAQSTATALAQSTATAQARAQSTATAAAQATATTQAILEAANTLAQTGKKAHGPSNGKLEGARAPYINSFSTGVYLKNFVADVRFTNPADRAVHPWDFGIGFRQGDVDDEYRLLVTSDLQWGLISTGKRLADRIEAKLVSSGIVPSLNVSPTGSNLVRLIVQNKVAYFLINNQLVSVLDVSERETAGNIYIATGMSSARNFPGLSMPYAEFVVLALP